VPAHSVADWTYDVSKQVGAFTITGLIAFTVAKRSNVWNTINQVEWETVTKVLAAAIAAIAGVFALITAIVDTL
jgi:hypothetical protein